MFIQPFQGTCWSFVSKNSFQWCVQRARPLCLQGRQHVTQGYFQHCALSGSSSSNNKNNTKFLTPFQQRISYNTQLLSLPKNSFYRLFTSTTPNQRLLDLDELSLEEKIKMVKYEFELLREEGVSELPTEVNENDWDKLANIGSAIKRKKFFRFLFLNEMKGINDLKEKEKRRIHSKERHAIISEELKSAGENYISYGLWRNCTMLKISNKSINRGYNMRLINARLYGQPIVFDDDYDANMTPREKSELGKQVALCFGLNRTYLDPFYIHMCNFDREHETAKCIQRNVPVLHNGSYPVDTHRESYIDLFPKDKLVYLTPDAKENMSAYDHDAIYVIGNIVDRGSILPLSVAKAKKEGLIMQKFPLDIYLNWGLGSKCLTLNQVLGILLEMKRSDSWVKAFDKYIPKRKLTKLNEDGPSIKQKMMKTRRFCLREE